MQYRGTSTNGSYYFCIEGVRDCEGCNHEVTLTISMQAAETLHMARSEGPGAERGGTWHLD